MGKNTKDFFIKKKEWSKVKDKLLDTYLKPYFQKIAYTGKPIIYIDFFAGAGCFHGKDNNFLQLDNNSNFKKLDFYGSPLIALKSLKEVNNQKSSIKPRVSFVFIENKYGPELQETISDSEFKDFKYQVLNNSCTDIIYGIKEEERNLSKQNVFCYIDPYGVKNLHFSTFEKLVNLKPSSLELLINFNVHGFFRMARACKGVERIESNFDELEDGLEGADIDLESLKSKKGKDLLDSVMGCSEWQEVVLNFGNEVINGEECRKKLKSIYKKQLENKLNFEYVMILPIRFNETGPCKYHLIFCTNNINAAVIMGDNMKNRLEYMHEYMEYGQMSLFPELYMEQEESLLVSHIKSIISNHKGIGFTELKARLYCDYPLPRYSINACIKKLEKDNIIKVERKPAISQTGRRTFFLDEKGINSNSIFLIE